MTRFYTSLLALVALFTSNVFAVTPLIVKGSSFVNSVDNSRFQIIGVDYQPGGSSGFMPQSGIDALSVPSTCLRDAVLLQRLGVNTIRVYNLDPDFDHSSCASIFNAAGIYMILDVNSPLPNQSLNRAAPWESYSSLYLSRVFQLVAGFMNFPNTLGFFAGNEVINEDSVPLAPAYIRAVTRDIKAFIAKQAPRPIPVGYSAADVRPLLLGSFNYLSCNLANDTLSKIDFFGLNSYSWCGAATFQSSGYDVLTSDFGNTTVPVFFSEYGCNNVEPRVFSEVAALYSSQMNAVFSGGLIYEYSQEVNDYGLVNINSNNTISLLVDYNNLMTQYDALNLKQITTTNQTAINLQAPTCSISLISSTNFTQSFALPARPDGVQTLIDNGVNGTYPAGVSSVTNTAEPVAVYDVNGNPISGLKLVVLASNQSNLPGNNTSGTTNPSSTTSSPSSSATKKNGAVRRDDVSLAALLFGTLTIGLFMQL